MGIVLDHYDHWIATRWGLHKEPLSNARLAVAGLGLGGEAGEAQEHVKKFLRDGKPLGKDFLLEAGDVLHYLTVLLHHAGYTLEDAMRANIQKLMQREAAGAPMRASSNTMPEDHK